MEISWLGKGNLGKKSPQSRALGEAQAIGRVGSAGFTAQSKSGHARCRGESGMDG